MATKTNPQTFAEKFEDALKQRREQDDRYGLKTLARELAKGDPRKTEIIRRRLMKYRPPKGGGSAEVAPTPPTRHEIEDALGLRRDTLAPDPETFAMSHPLEALFNLDAIDRLMNERARLAVERVRDEARSVA